MSIGLQTLRDHTAPAAGWAPWRPAVRFVRRSPLSAVAFAFIGVLVIVAILAPWIAPFDPLELHRSDRLSAPDGTYWMGTDQTGRDQFSRLVYGTQVSLFVGTVPILLSGLVGMGLGVLCGYCGGWTDILLQRIADACVAIPSLVIALTLVALLGPSLNNVVIAIAVVTVPTMNRVSRAATLQTINLPYVLAARSVGASHARIIARHVLPNITGSVVVVGGSLTGGAILAEAGLSFLGVGVLPPTPTWGNMIGGENRTFFEIAPWLVIVPGVAITLTVLAFNLAGDGVRDLLDPRARTEGH